LYASELEMKYFKEYIEPKLESGEIVNVDKQVKYLLQPAFNDMNGKHYREMNYISDFDITYSDGTFKVVDVKGMLKSEDKIKEKLFKYHYPNIDFEFIGKSLIDGGWVSIDTIIQGRKRRKKDKQSKLKGEN